MVHLQTTGDHPPCVTYACRRPQLQLGLLPGAEGGARQPAPTHVRQRDDELERAGHCTGIYDLSSMLHACLPLCAHVSACLPTTPTEY